MTGAITRGRAVRGDLSLWDGISTSSSRIDASGGTVSGVPVGDSVDVLQVYGAGSARTKSSIDKSISAIGTIRNATLSFAPGTWTITEDLTIPSNFAAFMPRGCYFDVSSGKTLTFSGPVYSESSDYSIGSGDVVFSVNSIVDGDIWIARTDAEISAGVVPTNLAYPPGHLPRYGAVGDGTTNDRAAWIAALSSNKMVVGEFGATYSIGDITSATAIFDMTGLSHRVIDFAGCKIEGRTTGGDYNAPLFQLDNLDTLEIRSPWVEDLGFDQTKTWKGLSFIRLHPVTGTVRNVHVTGMKLKGVVSPIDCDDATFRASGIWMDGEVNTCYYGPNLRSNGDDCHFNLLIYNAVRSYFCGGVITHRGHITSDNHAAAGNADFLIKSTTATFPTRDIRMSFTSRNSLATTNPQLVFESQNDSGDAAITDCDIVYDDTGSGSIADSIAFRHYSAAGVLQATDPNTKGRIRVRGRARGTITHSSVPTAFQDQNLDDCQGIKPAFGAYKSAASNNVTGDGTVVDVVFDTELHDLASNYNNSTGVFTAPRDGLYSFTAAALLLGRTAAETRVDLMLVTSVKTFYDTATESTVPIPEIQKRVAVEVYLKSAQTAKVQVAAYNGTKVVDLHGDSTLIATYFTGSLICGGPKSP